MIQNTYTVVGRRSSLPHFQTYVLRSNNNAVKIRPSRVRNSNYWRLCVGANYQWSMEASAEWCKADPEMCKVIKNNVPLRDLFHMKEDYESHEIQADTLVIGGDANEADIVLDVDTISGVHAKLRVAGPERERLYLTDLDSANGTSVDGKDLAKKTEVELVPGAVVSLAGGDIQLTVMRNILVHA